jgi:hypothetical protein
MRDAPNPRRAPVVGAADATYWVMQRAFVELLMQKGFMSKDTLCGEGARTAAAMCG